ncbi:conserved hypothetical protein [Frankia canadensis]|uniref:Uncharacterized protein n=1 Tax=Frankia canadensis TaxID=1836972 RepID=A0A2I2KK89_9ACTN|nr:Lsr2 family protein [Frankia canadensis]SNQ46089.1 conserved hypothetical protein [Frankia canadensis]SOU53379.1 conserved hypothetical protein [Frankia canadensis]
MAREVISIVNVWCDNSGQHPQDRAVATTTATLAYDGRLVRLDLCNECRDEMSSVLGEYADYGETIELSRTTRVDTAWTPVEKNDAATPPSAVDPEPKPARGASSRARARRPHQAAANTEVRSWLLEHADEHGLPLPDRRSRLSDELKAAYDRAHGWAEVDGTWQPAAATPTSDGPTDDAAAGSAG